MNTRNPAAYRTYRKDVVMSNHIAKTRSSLSMISQSYDTLVECAKQLLAERPASLPDLGIDLEAVALGFDTNKYDDCDTVMFHDVNSSRNLLFVEFYKNGTIAVTYILDKDEEESTLES